MMNLILNIRFRIWQGEKIDLKEVVDLMDALHNVPEYLVKNEASEQEVQFIDDSLKWFITKYRPTTNYEKFIEDSDQLVEFQRRAKP